MNGLEKSIKTLSSTYHYSLNLLQYLSQEYGGFEELEKVLKALTVPSKVFTIRTNLLKTSSETLCKKFEQYGITVSCHPYVPDALIINYSGPYDVPNYRKNIIADKQAAEAVLQGGHLFLPGIKKLPQIQPNEKVTIMDEYGRPVAAGIVQISSQEIQQLSHGLVVKVTDPKYKLPALSDLQLYTDGLFYSQSLPAIITSHMFDPFLDEIDDEFILDLCAAPGGKTTHLAQLVNNKSLILAVDRSKRRLARLQEASRRMGISCIKTIQADVIKLASQREDLRTRFILLDPPCTALGVRPKLYEETTTDSINALAKYQKRLLIAADRFLKPGGVLVYSTCTLTQEENEQIVEYAVRELGFKHPTPLSSKDLIPQIIKASKNKTQTYTARFEPHIHGTLGYFIARLVKKN